MLLPRTARGRPRGSPRPDARCPNRHTSAPSVEAWAAPAIVRTLQEDAVGNAAACPLERLL